MAKSKEQIIMGIDPGVANTGYGLIRKRGEKLELIDYGCITTSSQFAFRERLEKIHKDLKKIIRKYKPTEIAIEKIFFCKNVKTALMVGEARGVALLVSIQSGLTLSEFTPLEVKQAITSYGRASKGQIQEMVRVLLNLEKIPKPDDAADALAVAICRAQTKRFK